MTHRVRMVCSECDSEDVLADAYAQWDPMSQVWELVETFPKGAYCAGCGCGTRIEEQPLQS
ncbi:MAG: hypothetical protein C5B56_08310 [Proteobacteria bacterium]|nr:MAG: hypothetical protein C5B56_08310 [Pseudomonadota bacterium]